MLQREYCVFQMRYEWDGFLDGLLLDDWSMRVLAGTRTTMVFTFVHCQITMQKHMMDLMMNDFKRVFSGYLEPI